jgi:hypothetical protein
MEQYLNFFLYCGIVAVVLCILWQCVFAPYKKYRKEQLRKFTELAQEEEDAFTDIEIDEKI